MGHQDGLQQAEQHQRKNDDAVGGCRREEKQSGAAFTPWKPPAAAPPLRVRTYDGGLVGHGGQDVVEDEQQDGDGQQHGDLEAQLLSSVVGDEEGGQVQGQEEEDGQQEVDDVEEGPPLYGELRSRVRGQGESGPSAADRHASSLSPCR